MDLNTPQHFADIKYDDRQCLRRLTKSDDFLLFLREVVVRRLNVYAQKLANPTNTVETYKLLVGQRLAMQNLLDDCCKIAGIEGFFTPQLLFSPDLSRFKVAEEPQTAESSDGERTGGSYRPAFPA